MATPFSNPSTEKLLIGFLVLLNIIVISAQTTSFNYPSITNDDGSFILQGNAQIQSSRGFASLPDDDSIASRSETTGRILYGIPVTIWDSRTGNVASFVTSFSIRMTNYGNYSPADGLIFFLAPWWPTIPPSSSGGRLGVVDGNTSFNRFVGVEFDTFSNEWDPNFPHIGIDVNSLISVNSVKWNRVSGALEKVSIVYDAPAKTLNVVVTHENGQFTTISQYIDLKLVLPEQVSIGFSATTTRDGREYHGLHSWSFSSILNTNNPTLDVNVSSA